MKIIRFKRKKLGDSYAVVTITYKKWWGKKTSRDAVLSKAKLWTWCDTGSFVFNDTALIVFWNSGAYDYDLNE